MTNEDFIKMGIVAKQEFDITEDVCIEFSSQPDFCYVYKKIGENGDMQMCQSDIVKLNRNSKINFSIGYSELFDILAIYIPK